MTTARNTICLPAEVLAALGKAGSATDDDRGLVNMILPLIDNAIGTFLEWNVIQKTYTCLVPDTDLYDVAAYQNSWPYGDPFDARTGGQISFFYPGTPQIVQVPNIPLRQVVSIYVDFAAAGGTAAVDFGSGTLLTQGVDYYPMWDSPSINGTIPFTTGISWTGQIRRWLGGVWAGRSQTGLVTYVAGVTPDELDGVVQFPSRRVGDIKLAAIISAVAQFREFKAWSDRAGGQEAGPIIAERLADYSATYAETAIMQATGLTTQIPLKAQLLLMPHRRMQI